MAGESSSTNSPPTTGGSTDQLTSTSKGRSTGTSPASRWRRGISYVKSLGKFRDSKKDEEQRPSTPTISTVKGSLEVETTHVTLPAPDIFSNPHSPFFLGRDGLPITRPSSLRSFSSTQSKPASIASSTQVTPTTTGFQWKPQAVVSVSDVKDPEAQSRVEHVITRCGLDDKKVTPQEAYDALRIAKGSVNDAYELIKRGEHIFSSAVDDPEVREHLQDIGVLLPDAAKRKKVKFARSHTYIN
ncbi:hypothetical protein F4805DRAFT_455273 [Annulohypoxylon moriforme]|nr:hypothetical protein F4805DRAFT_455273 [Annulohypoxylon moriforme]